jgi:hypothetical protein
MTKQPDQKHVEAVWRQMRKELGRLGDDLDFAREWVGDADFILLAQEYGAEEVVISCGIQHAAEGLGLTLRRDLAPRDIELQDAIAAAHDAVRQQSL